MNWLQALLMGAFQGLTEYLPVSSSGHLAIAGKLLGVEDPGKVMMFTVTVHVATVFSTLVILRREIGQLLKGFFTSPKNSAPSPYGFKCWNEEQNYIFNIFVSMIPVGIVGLCFKDFIEAQFNSFTVVGVCLLITAFLLSFSYFAKPRRKEHITVWNALVIGIAQAFAVLPGLSRSGSTIGTGLILGNKKESLAQFSFLIVIPPILAEALLDAKKVAEMGVEEAMAGITPSALVVGFFSAFIIGCIACKWMIGLVRKGKMIWFAIYCAVVGLAVLVFL